MKILNDFERLSLVNQFELMLLQTDDEYQKEELENKIEVLKEGYTGLYDEVIFSGLYPNNNEDTTKTVHDILTLYDNLQKSYENLSDDDKQQINFDDLIFLGFDGNEENDYYNQCKFIIKKLHQYKYLKHSEDLNTHGNTLTHYKRELEIYNQIVKQNQKDIMHENCYLFTADQILQVINKCN